MSDLIRLLICDANSDVREYYKRGFEGHPRIRVAYLTQDGKEAIKRARDGAPDAVLIDHNLLDMSGLDLGPQIARVSPETVIFLLSDNPWSSLVTQARALGMRDVLDKKLSPAEIAIEIERWVDTAREEMKRRVSNMPQYAPGRGPFGSSPWQETTAHTVRQMVLAVTSGTKGGTGKTTISTSLACAAAALARETGKIRVALVDFNESGNVALQLNLGEDEALAPHNVNNWAYILEDAPRDEIDQMLVQHRDSGLLVVPSVLSPERHDEVSEELVQKIIRILRKHCTLVICDVPPSAKGPTTWATIEAADAAVVVVKPDVQDVKDIYTFYDLMSKLRLTSKLNGVMNLVGDPRFSDARFIETNLNKLTGLSFIGQLPYEPLVSQGV
ncbi:MAG: response regulator [Firmicutes bacterium]|nr:response regulator [Bacillota bacterium]